MLCWLDIDYSDCYLQILHDMGYAATRLTPKMSANLWTSMCEDANLQTGQQQCIVNSFILYHLGKRVCVKEQEITEGGSNFVPYNS
jgi:hypothetical protein